VNLAKLIFDLMKLIIIASLLLNLTYSQLLRGSRKDRITATSTVFLGGFTPSSSISNTNGNN